MNDIPLTREEIVKEAKEWIGTPYHHLARLKGVGCDCIGLIVGVWVKLKVDLPVPVPVYSPQWNLHQKESQLLRVLQGDYNFKLLNTRDPPPGSVLCFGLEKCPAHHAGIMTERGTFVHSFMSTNNVVEVPLVGKWVERLHAVLDFPGVE